MNGNRSRYSTNPTFSMQKRSIFRKPAQQLPDKPDFGAAAEPAAPQPQQQVPQGPLGAPPVPPVAELFGTQPVPSAPVGMPVMPKGSIHFSPAPQQPPVQAQTGGLFTMQTSAPMGFPQQQNLPPLGNQPTAAQGAPFSPHAQGFTPPASTQFPAPLLGAPAQPQQPLQTKAPAAPTVQPAGFTNPFEAQPQPGFSNPYGMQQPQAQNRQQAAQPVDTDTLWKLFLFVLIPVLFVPCMFIPASFNVLRYIFIALCVAAIGIIWYRNMFKPNPRIAVTLAYALACIIIVVLLFQGTGSDPRNAQTDPAAAQQQTAMDPVLAAGEAGSPQVTFTPTPEPTPTIAPVSEAQTRLEAFMVNWSGARIEDLVRLVQPSWASAQDNPSNRLFVLLGNRTPLSYNIEEISGSDNDSSRTVTMTANIDKNNGKDPTLYRFMVLMVKEGGEWYVDPNSLATNDEVANKEESAVVNDSQSTKAENWTIAPRQTVTPAPPASQPLYYNPDGGSMYHMDQYCPSVKEEYLPLTGSFPYADLGEHRDKTPCLRCGAPTQTLPPDDTSY